MASNRSAASYTPEKTVHSFEELYDPLAPEEDREFVARAALGKALIISTKGGTKEAARAARFFADANLPPHAAQGPRPERPARRLARSRDPALQRAGLAPRPQRTLILKMMKYLLHTLSCLLLFAAETCLAQTPGHTLRSGGIDRTYRLHLPEGLPDGAPLVIVLHGYGGQGCLLYTSDAADD